MFLIGEMVRSIYAYIHTEDGDQKKFYRRLSAACFWGKGERVEIR